MKTILLIDACIFELESASWLKEIVHEEAKRLSKRLLDLEQTNSLLNTLIYSLTIPDDLVNNLNSQIEKSSIDFYINSVDALYGQYLEFKTKKPKLIIRCFKVHLNNLRKYS